MSVLARPGDLAEVPLATVLVEALQQRVTGELHVADGAGVWRIMVGEGRVFAVIAPGGEQPEPPVRQTAALAHLGALDRGRFSFEPAGASTPSGSAADLVEGAVVDMSELGGVLAGPPSGEAAEAPARRSDPEVARRRRQRLLRQGMRNLGVGPLAGQGRRPPVEPQPARGVEKPVERASHTEREQQVELRRALAEAAPRARSADLYARLGVARGASPAELRKAYFELARRIHPDHFAAPELADVAAQAKEVFAAINEAHEVLSDERKRSAHLATPAAADDAVSADRREAGAADFQRAEACARTRDFAKARGYYEAALRAEARPEYQEAYAWMLYWQHRPLDRAKAKGLADAALQDAKRDRAALIRALIARDEGDDAKAEHLLRRALQANPDNADAQREFRAWRARSEERAREARRELRAVDGG
jgi:curved DNA-binding protein CbpA